MEMGKQAAPAAAANYENHDQLGTELRLGLPGTQHSKAEKQICTAASSNFQQQQLVLMKSKLKRSSSELDKYSSHDYDVKSSCDQHHSAPPPNKAQAVGWPPVRSFRRNVLRPQKKTGSISSEQLVSGMYMKVSMDGAPYLRKLDLRMYTNYQQLLKALEGMFKCTIGTVFSEREGYNIINGSDYAPTYEDKDGDWMLVGDVPWAMFITSCRRLRVMKGSEAKGLCCNS